MNHFTARYRRYVSPSSSSCQTGLLRLLLEICTNEELEDPEMTDRPNNPYALGGDQEDCEV